MQYTQRSFTLPACNAPITDLEYEVRVGLRCADCLKLTDECECKEVKDGKE